MAGAFADAVQAGRSGAPRRRHGRAGFGPAQHAGAGHAVLASRGFPMTAMTDASIHRAGHRLAAHAARFGETAARHRIVLVGRCRSTAARSRPAATLGFIDIDAECLARAWQAQSERTGRFDAEAWPDTPADFGLRSFPPTRARRCISALSAGPRPLCVLPDAAMGRPHGARGRADGAVALQVRRRRAPSRARSRRRSRRCAAPAPCSSSTTTGSSAIAARAYGLHLGQEDLDALAPAQLQAIRDSGIRLGVSTHGYAEMLRADLASPSYIAMGAVYPTTLKRMATAPQGVARLAAYARLMRGYPQVGIGGVDERAHARSAGHGRRLGGRGARAGGRPAARGGGPAADGDLPPRRLTPRCAAAQESGASARRSKNHAII